MPARWGSTRFAAAAAAAVFAAGVAPAQLLPASEPPGVPTVAPPTGTQAVPPPSISPPGLSFPQTAPVRRERFTVTIDPKATAKDLLPAAPKVAPFDPPATDDLSKVPEAEFEARRDPAAGDPAEHAAKQLARIGHVNAKKTDAFMAALLENRPDLAGLPFVMGDDCRTAGERRDRFAAAVGEVRQALATTAEVRAQAARPNGFNRAGPSPSHSFWDNYAAGCAPLPADKARAEHVTAARVAALTQMLAAEPADLRLGLVRHLTGVAHPEATKALARIAVFTPEDEVRSAAVDALKVRRERDYTDVLVKALRYPWPAVARRAADAAARLDRQDLIPELLAVLDEADPRLPRATDADGKAVAVVREVVRVNHHRNCMMCHAPAGKLVAVPVMVPAPGTTPHGDPAQTVLLPEEVPSAEVPVEGLPLPTPATGYGRSAPELMIRVDVTYLRPDFSAALPVADAHPWPELQRFDFLVRERRVTADEAAAGRAKLTPAGKGVVSPYHKAALAALRDLTGKDAAPTAAAWREVLDLPAKPGSGAPVLPGAPGRK
jgi:hypothetical protein